MEYEYSCRKHIDTSKVSFFLSLLEIASFPSGDSSNSLHQAKRSDIDTRDRNFNRQTLRDGLNGQVSNNLGPVGSSGAKNHTPVLPLLTYSLDKKNVGYFDNHTLGYHKHTGSAGEGIKSGKNVGHFDNHTLEYHKHTGSAGEGIKSGKNVGHFDNHSLEYHKHTGSAGEGIQSGKNVGHFDNHTLEYHKQMGSVGEGIKSGKNVGHFDNHTLEYHKKIGSAGKGKKMSGDLNCSEVLQDLEDLSDRGLCDSESVEDSITLNDSDSFHNIDEFERLENNVSNEKFIQWYGPQNSYNYSNDLYQALCKGDNILCHLTRLTTGNKNYKLGNVNDWIIDKEINNSSVNHDFRGNSYEDEINMNSTAQDIRNNGDINKQQTLKRFKKLNTRSSVNRDFRGNSYEDEINMNSTAQDRNNGDISKQQSLKKTRKYRFPLQPNRHSTQKVTDTSFFQFSSQLNLKLPMKSSHIRDLTEFNTHKHVHTNLENIASHITDSNDFVDIDNSNSNFANNIRLADTVVNVEIPYGKRIINTLNSSPLKELDRPSIGRFSIQGFGSNPAQNSLPRTHNHSNSTSFQTLHTNISYLSSTEPLIIQPFSATSNRFILSSSKSFLSPDMLSSSSSSFTMTSSSSLSPSFIDSTSPTSSSGPFHKLTPSLRTAYFITPNSLSLSPSSSLSSTADPDYDDGQGRENDFPARESRSFDVGEVPGKGAKDDIHRGDTFELALFLRPPRADPPWELPSSVARGSTSASVFDTFPTRQIISAIRPTSVLVQAIPVSNPLTLQGRHHSPPRVLYGTPKEQSSLRPYQFSYEVYNRENHYGHQEERVGATVTGTYHVILPNGLRQIVSYYADETGYHPTISYQRLQDIDPRSFPL
ncbi:probable cyclin-dependent serine/threonine-protein kinase DDB_G0292550 [Palaemon carinicauda]|uniref:probable cyclin-dependent serine/threonine-protein kinase DDB_G0292550 n=1 Tax=Palaemon carinicauda TaxID=392227 RepID=UPI0035B5EB5E